MGSFRLYLFILIAGLALIVVVLTALSNPSTPVNPRIKGGYEMGKPKTTAQLYELTGRAEDRQVLNNPADTKVASVPSVPELKLAPALSNAIKKPQVVAVPAESVPIPNFVQAVGNAFQQKVMEQGEQKPAQESTTTAAGILGVKSSSDSTQTQAQTVKQPPAAGAREAQGLRAEGREGSQALANAFRSGSLSAVEFTDQAYALLKGSNPQLGAELLQEVRSVEVLNRLADIQAKQNDERLWPILRSYADIEGMSYLSKSLRSAFSQPRTGVLLQLLGEKVESLRTEASAKFNVFRPTLNRLKAATARAQFSQKASEILSLMDQFSPNTVQASP